MERKRKSLIVLAALNWFWFLHLLTVSSSSFDISSYLTKLQLYLVVTPIGLAWQALGVYLSMIAYAETWTRNALASIYLNLGILIVYAGIFLLGSWTASGVIPIF